MTRNNEYHLVGQVFLLRLEVKLELEIDKQHRTRTRSRQANSLEVDLELALMTALVTFVRWANGFSNVCKEY